MVFDLSEPDINVNTLQIQYWSYSVYSSPGEELKEILPPNMPKPLGNGFNIGCFVDDDYAGNLVTRRSWTGFLVMLNKVPINWHTKNQGSVETSTFVSDFIAMKKADEYVWSLRYKLRMFGIPVEGPAFIIGDNQSVLVNSSMHESTIKKKSQIITFNFICEGYARDEWRTSYIHTSLNVADLMTKPLLGNKR